MIICGFPGIGKSTICKNDLMFIDFESSNFDKTNPKWYIDYCNCVLDLHKQGYYVFTSTHEQVTRYLSEHASIRIVYPSLTIKDEWEKRVQERYEKESTIKNENALKFVRNFLEDGVHSVEKNYSENQFVDLRPITRIDYDLQDYIFERRN